MKNITDITQQISSIAPILLWVDLLAATIIEILKNHFPNVDHETYESLGESCYWISPPKDLSMTDLTTSVCMMLAKKLKKYPLEIGELLSKELLAIDGISQDLESVLCVTPGFLNIRLSKKFIYTLNQYNKNLTTISGHKPKGDQQKKINIEIFSGNPTGPMHMGHARVTVIGDALASLLSFVGYDVTREFYVNDAGVQVQNLAKGVLWHYRQALDMENATPYPADAYPGEYVVEIAEVLKKTHNDKYKNSIQPGDNGFDEVITFSVDHIMTELKEQLQSLNIKYDIFTSEKKLHTDGFVEDALNLLTQKGVIAKGIPETPQSKKTREELTLFEWTDLMGKSQKTPIIKTDGSYTYVAGDIGYHWNKYQRGFDLCINVWGGDHAGHQERLKSALDMLTNDRHMRKMDIKIILCQMLRFSQNSLAFKMSKRQGSFVSIPEVIDLIGIDALRIMMLEHAADTHKEVDMDQLKNDSLHSPAFYIQYAFARLCSVLRHGEKMFPEEILSDQAISWDLLSLPLERQLMLFLILWPRSIWMAAQSFEPHRVFNLLMQAAEIFHTLWQEGQVHHEMRFLLENNRELSYARLALLMELKKMFYAGMTIMNITLKECL